MKHEPDKGNLRMNINNRNNAHNEIDRVFKILLPTRNMAERPAQVALSHRMLDAMLDGGIALCDAGTGIGKTYAYLVAGTAFSRFRAASGLALRPILISTSSIALQNAVRDEYLPLLSELLTADGMIAEPLQAVIRKGKSHYVCDERLEQRLGQLDLSKKNWRSGAALLTLRGQLDVSEAAHLSRYDRERVCVPQTCDCQRESCRYRSFLEECDTGQYLLICISGTTTARMNSRRVRWFSRSFSFRASGTANGRRGMISRDTQSPGKSKPSQAAPVASRTLPGCALNCSVVWIALRPMVNSG